MVALASLAISAAHAANDARPMIGPGATKDDVINAFGWPNGQSQSGTKEVLSYAQGEVLLENGRVERVSFSPNVPWQTPKPRPAPPTASTRKRPEPPMDRSATRVDVATGAAPAATEKAAPTSPGSPTAASNAATARAVGAAGRLVLGGLLVGGVLVIVILWRLWRRPVAKATPPLLPMADRIDAAAGGIPTVAEMNGWTKERLRAVTAALAECDAYAAHLRPAGEPIDVELRKRGDLKPRVLVCCSPGSAGVVGARLLRGLFGTLASEGVGHGWFVSPAGFSNDAREYAAAHRITLVNSEGLHAMMRDVPPVSLPHVLART